MTPTPPKTIPELINGLTQLTESNTKPTEILRDEVINFMTSYNGKDWEKFAFWDDLKYTRNRIYLDPEGRFELILLCWNISQLTPIHNHPNSQCFFKLMQGELVEKIFDTPNPSIKRKKMKVIETNQLNKLGNTGYIEDGMGVHLVENQSPSDKCVTLHLYSPAYETVNCYDERTGQVTIHGCGNYSIGGVRCDEEGKCLCVDKSMEVGLEI